MFMKFRVLVARGWDGQGGALVKCVGTFVYNILSHGEIVMC